MRQSQNFHLVSFLTLLGLTVLRRRRESQEEEEEEEEGGGGVQKSGMLLSYNHGYWIPRTLVRRIDAPLV